MEELLTPLEYYHAFTGCSKYDEEKHCPMLLDILPKKGRVSAFCKEARIAESTFYEWIKKHPKFKQIFGIAKVIAQENWEEEGEKNRGNPEWDRKEWILRGSRYFAKDKSKINLRVDAKASPWEQYAQILKQAGEGEFNASEIKQLMESVNVGTRVYETFKLQSEVDKMNEELRQMSQNHGHYTIPDLEIEENNKITVLDKVCR